MIKKKCFLLPIPTPRGSSWGPWDSTKGGEKDCNSFLTNWNRLLGHFQTHTTQKPHKELSLPVSSQEGVGHQPGRAHPPRYHRLALRCLNYISYKISPSPSFGCLSCCNPGRDPGLFVGCFYIVVFVLRQGLICPAAGLELLILQPLPLSVGITRMGHHTWHCISILLKKKKRKEKPRACFS